MSDITDEEILKRVAAVEGYEIRDGYIAYDDYGVTKLALMCYRIGPFNPLTNDAQAMELVKKHFVQVIPPTHDKADTFSRRVLWGAAIGDKNGIERSMDANRAICLAIINREHPT